MAVLTKKSGQLNVGSKHAIKMSNFRN